MYNPDHHAFRVAARMTPMRSLRCVWARLWPWSSATAVAACYGEKCHVAGSSGRGRSAGPGLLQPTRAASRPLKPVTTLVCFELFIGGEESRSPPAGAGGGLPDHQSCRSEVSPRVFRSLFIGAVFVAHKSRTPSSDHDMTPGNVGSSTRSGIKAESPSAARPTGMKPYQWVMDRGEEDPI